MPPAVPSPVPPRQPGESAYAYRKRRSVALFGQTPYQRRIASATARGQTRQQARGHAVTAGQVSEYQARNARSVQQTGFTLTQRRNMVHDQWLVANGFTPATTGMSWTALRRVQMRLQWISENSAPGGMITPGMIEEYTDMERMGILPRGWVTDRIYKKYDAMVAFRNGSPGTGNFYWFHEGGSENAGSANAAWWYYH